MPSLIKNRGLYTYRNELRVPEGALEVADNIVIDEDDVAQPRRGFADYGDILSNASLRLKQLINYKDTIIRHYDDVLEYDDGSGNFIAFDGSYSELQSGIRIKAKEAKSNLFFTTSEGIKKISAVTSGDFTNASGFIANAGVPKGLDLDTSVTTSGVTWLPAESQVAYRIVWGKKDANENLLLGAPSSRTVVTNTNENTPATTIYSFSGLPAASDYLLFSTPNDSYFAWYNTGSDVEPKNASTLNRIGVEVNISGLTTASEVAAATATAISNNLNASFDVDLPAATQIEIVAKDVGPVLSSSTESATNVSLSIFTDGSFGDAVNVELSIQVPEDIDDTYFCQVYRTSYISIDLSTTVEDIAGDEMNLVDERAYTNTNPFIIKDETPEDFRDSGALLYTNPVSGQGILQANSRPPIALDIDFFRGSMFYGNTKTVHRLSINLLSSSGLDGESFILSNTNITRTYTFQEFDSSSQSDPSTTNVSGGIIGVDTNTSLSTSQKIDIASRNLIKIINKDNSSDIYGFYESTGDSLPGLMSFENRTLEDIEFNVSVSNSSIENKFNPELSSAEVSSNEESKNRLYFSKTDQPESVPILNYINIGGKDKRIQRVIALRDNLFVLKEDGVFIVTGSTAPNFQSRLLDESTPIIAPDTAKVLNNTIYCLSTQGVASISDSGVSVISRSIEDQISAVSKSSFNTKTVAFGVSYESDRSYTLWLPTSQNDTEATQAFRFNSFTQSWTRWSISATCGLVNSGNDKLYLGAGDRAYTLEERKNGNRTDYADRDFERAFLQNRIDEKDIAVSSVNDIEIGDSIVQTQYVTAVQFNKLLKMLDLDPNLATSTVSGGAGFVNTVGLIVAGDFLKEKLQMLDTALDSDVNLVSYSSVPIDDSFEDLQSNFNAIVSQLNSPTLETFYKNYIESTGTTFYETLIVGVDSLQNTISVVNSLPFLFGTQNGLTIYKAIKSKIQWHSQHFQEPEKLKQIKDGTVLFDQNNFYSAILGFQSDLSRTFDEISFLGRGNGDFGSLAFGEFIFGGEGSDVPFRTLIPKEKQRCRYLTCRFRHINSREFFRILGISMEPRTVSARGYR